LFVVNADDVYIGEIRMRLSRKLLDPPVLGIAGNPNIAWRRAYMLAVTHPDYVWEEGMRRPGWRGFDSEIA
jgi:hypothetical protein